MTDHLIDFFAENVTRKAAVPGLGVFYAEKNVNGRYRILFEEVAPKGKEFINHVAFRMNVTEGEAVAALDEWVKDILKSLKSVKVATLPGIGTFEVNEGRVQFLPSAEQDLTARFGLEKKNNRPAAEVEAEVEPDEDEDVEDEDEESTPEDRSSRKKRRTTVLWICVGVVMLGLIGGMLYYLKPLDFLASNESDKIDEIILGNPIQNGTMPEEEEEAAVAAVPPVPAPSMSVSDDDIKEAIEAEEREKKEAKAASTAKQSASAHKSSEPVAKPAAKEAAKPTPVTKPAPEAKPEPKPVEKAKPAPAPKPAAKPAPAAKPTPKPEPLAKGVSRPVSGRFYIVVGSFSNLDNARTRYNELASTSAFDMRILFDSEKNIYKVSVKEFNDKLTAIQFKKGLLDNGFDGWIYEHK